MTAVAYAMSDFAGVKIPEARGGCGEFHAAATSEDGYLCVECDQCAPTLVGTHYGFAATPEGVPSTPDELAHSEYMEREAKSANAAVDVQMRRNYMREHAGKSLAEQVAGLSPREKAELASLLKGDDEKPARRGPGRPPKAATTSSK